MLLGGEAELEVEQNYHILFAESNYKQSKTGTPWWVFCVDAFCSVWSFCPRVQIAFMQINSSDLHFATLIVSCLSRGN